MYGSYTRTYIGMVDLKRRKKRSGLICRLNVHFILSLALGLCEIEIGVFEGLLRLFQCTKTVLHSANVSSFACTSLKDPTRLVHSLLTLFVQVRMKRFHLK